MNPMKFANVLFTTKVLLRALDLELSLDVIVQLNLAKDYLAENMLLKNLGVSEESKTLHG